MLKILTKLTEFSKPARPADAAGPYILPAIVLLVGLSAFGLGRLSVLGEGSPRLIIRMSDGTTQAPRQGSGQAAAVGKAVNSAPSPSQVANVGVYVASKSGTKYYLPSCAGVARIKEENKVWFTTAGEAQAAGYTAAANCPGL